MLTGRWKFDGDETDLKVFSKRFKIQRGKAAVFTRRAADEQCFGVLCYERSDAFNPILEIVPPMLDLATARRAVEVLEQLYPNGGVDDWERLENELRRRGYTGQSICPYSLADAVGFFILAGIGYFTVSQLEEASAGFIEEYLKVRGYVWLEAAHTWQSPNGNLWDRRERVWRDERCVGDPSRWNVPGNQSGAILQGEYH